MTCLFALWDRPVVTVLGLALLHSLWQGILIALLLAGALHRLRRRSANARYLAAWLALVAMAIFPLLTALGAVSGSPFVPTKEAQAVAPHALEALRTTDAPWLSFTRADALLPALVALWLVGVSIQSARMLVGWLMAQRLVNRKTLRRADALQEKAAELARRLSLTRLPDVFESARVEVPAVIGWLRVVILIPPSALTGLTPGALEALLAHELAHIRRHDYLANLFQTLLDTLLFYHPAARWISQRIRIEREHCCDDLAVEVLGDRIHYARALASLEELRAAPSALALGSNGGDLLTRIRRLLGMPDAHSLSFPLAGSAPLAACALLGALTLAQAASSRPVAAPKAPQSPPASPQTEVISSAENATTSADTMRTRRTRTGMNPRSKTRSPHPASSLTLMTRGNGMGSATVGKRVGDGRELFGFAPVSSTERSDSAGHPLYPNLFGREGREEWNGERVGDWRARGRLGREKPPGEQPFKAENDASLEPERPSRNLVSVAVPPIASRLVKDLPDRYFNILRTAPVTIRQARATTSPTITMSANGMKLEIRSPVEAHISQRAEREMKKQMEQGFREMDRALKKAALEVDKAQRLAKQSLAQAQRSMSGAAEDHDDDDGDTGDD